MKRNVTLRKPKTPKEDLWNPKKYRIAEAINQFAEAIDQFSEPKVSLREPADLGKPVGLREPEIGLLQMSVCENQRPAYANQKLIC